MNDELSEPMQVEMFAASLRADYTDVAAFLEALAAKFEGSLPTHTKVMRQSGLFSREHPVKEIAGALTSWCVHTDSADSPEQRLRLLGTLGSQCFGVWQQLIAIGSQ